MCTDVSSRGRLQATGKQIEKKKHLSKFAIFELTIREGTSTPLIEEKIQ